MDRFYLQMHITNKCHNRCKHCYQTVYDGHDMTAAEASLVISELSEIGKKMYIISEVAITGGDPMYNSNFFEIAALARALCDRVVILGNPELLTSSMISYLFDF